MKFNTVAIKKQNPSTQSKAVRVGIQRSLTASATAYLNFLKSSCLSGGCSS